jgi:hypothetical protein
MGFLFDAKSLHDVLTSGYGYQNHWFFKRPDGCAVPACGYQASDTLDDTASEVSNLYNHPSAEGLLTSVKSSCSAASPG